MNLPSTVLVERLLGSFHSTDLRFGLVDAEFYAVFDGAISEINILQFFKICPFSKVRAGKCTLKPLYKHRERQIYLLLNFAYS